MKKVFITGISKGLGKELFEQLSVNYFVYGLLRDKDIFDALNCSKPKNCKLILADVSSDECILSIQNSIKNDTIDFVINNAGIAGDEIMLEKVESNEIMNVFNVHCLGVLRVMKALHKNLDVHALVLNMNSRLGSIHRQSLGTYNSLDVSYSYRIAKAAQNMLTNCLKQEFKSQTFVSLMPGKLKTQISQTDADILPFESAKMIVDLWENGFLTNKNGIIELNGNIIEW